MKMQFGLVTLLVACGGESVIEKQDNTAPTVIIGSHSPDAEILEGYVESFRATVSDDDNDYDELTVAWYVGEEIVCDWESVSPAGEAFCDIVFTEEDTNVVVEVRDPIGAGGRAEIAVVVVPTSAPTAQILSPTQNSNHYSDQLIQFSGMVDDNEDNPENLIVTWSSSLDGDLILDTSPDSDGMISDYGYLSEGQHALELKVEDSSGKITKEQLVLQVGAANQIPLCEILSPQTQTAIQFGDSILFEALSTDANIPATELLAVWSSDKDGELGDSQITSNGDLSFTTSTLSANDHIISLTVTDEVGAFCRDEVVLFVGSAPTAVIQAPLSGEVFSTGDDVLFQGSVSDAEDLMNELTLSWVSIDDGELIVGSPDSQGSHQFATNALSAGLHTISLSATDTTGLVGSDTVTIRVNTPPTSPMVSFNPNPVYGNSTLTVAAIGSADADGDPVSYSYQWFEDGIVHSSTTTSVGSSDLNVGEVWTVRVTPNDGYTDGVYTESSITISNSEPTVTTPIVSSSSGGVYNDSVLTCTSTASDADETVTPTYSWDVNGSTVVGNTVDLSNYSISVGDSIECSAMVMDSNGGSATSQSVEMIENRDPSISSVSISPSSPISQDLLTCSVVSSDMDGESLTESMEWFVAGSSVSTSMTLDLSSVGASPSDTIECVVVVMDPSGGSDQSSSTVSVVNTNPTIDVLTLTPNEPTLNDTLSCYAESSDLDGDTPTIGFSFTNQTTGSVYSPTTMSTNVATLDISSTDADYEHILTCEVTSTDSDNGSSTDSISVTIVNTGPVFDQGAVITPSVAEIGTDVECSAVASDPDDGVASLSYVWQVNGVQVSTGSTWTVNASDASVGDDLTCMAVAVDFEGNSTTSNSVPVTLSNTAPVVSAVVLNNLSPYTNDTVSVSSSTFDFNGDAVTLTYEWHILDASNGGQDTIIQAGPGTIFSSLDGSQSLGFDRDDEIYVNVTPNDGSDNGVTVESDHAIVLNTTPTSPSVVVTSTTNPPLEGVDDLTCTIIGGSTDLDGDPIDYTYTWYDPTGTDVQVLANTSTMFDTFAGTSTTPGLWECDVVASDGTDTANASADIEVDSDWAGPLTFTNCGQTGRSGPSQSQCDSEYSGSTLDGLVTLSSGIQTFVFPISGIYSVTVVGAAGGGSGGAGIEMSGTFSFTVGDSISLVVGQLGSGSSSTTGGGGGSFVWATNQTTTPLIVAGGGGGEGALMSSGLHNATTSTNGQNGCDGSGWGPSSPGIGGSAGNGGTGGSGGNYGENTGAGGGWYSNGSPSNTGGSGGLSFTGGAGEGTADGGFGGGGGADSSAAGGGGGYSGGGGGGWGSSSDYRGACGGGGGSYNGSSNQSNGSSTSSSNGFVVIEKL